jgi:hypothetical protein
VPGRLHPHILNQTLYHAKEINAMSDRPPLNGTTLHLALPNLSATRGIVGYYIVVDTGSAWCQTYVSALTDTSWGQGHYFPHSDKGRDDAIVAAYLAAHIHVMPWSEIEAKHRKISSQF